MPFPMKMFPRATQTREVDVLAEFLMRVHHAMKTGEYGPGPARSAEFQRPLIFSR